MSNIAIIPKINLPAELMQHFQSFVGEDDLNAGVSAGFPVMSIRGAKWRIVEGGEEHPVYLPDSKDLAPFVKVVLLRANANISKTFYAGQYVEGSDIAPDCYSNDGVAPAPDSTNPQCASCAACPQNVWGSKISPSGSKIKACADVRRMAILPAEDLGYSPILLRVPGASLGDLAQYGKALKQRGIPYAAVVTKLSFDPDAAFPKIMFQFERVLTQEEMATVAERLGESVVEDILGTTTRGVAPAQAAPADDKFGIPADVQAPAGNATAAASAPASQSADAGEGTAQNETASAPAAEAKPAARKTTAKKTAAPEPAAEAPASEGGAMVDDLEAALAALNL